MQRNILDSMKNLVLTTKQLWRKHYNDVGHKHS